ncbi:alpha/beta-hydrolase [Tothia fuscella]|uniref:Alpha/beta-hydrolase n=1 Tax=Tothia fuscella TaxID=1048955 RepID=A0A9P4TTL8_9PEZI|nr:alpha/beta-hydrolase [Tothia fuscella]
MKLHLFSLGIISALHTLGNAASVHLDVSIDIDQDPHLGLKAHNEVPLVDQTKHNSKSQSTGQDSVLVDLAGYQHRGYVFPDAGDASEAPPYIKFSNIRYAEPPLGNLRWAPPTTYYSETGETEDGLEERACPQVNPGWYGNTMDFVACYLNPTCNLNQWKDPIDFGQYKPSYPDGGVLPGTPPRSEDCLLLDVYVPKAAWDTKGTKKVPVVVWIHGGGFTMGWKGQPGSTPTGLFQIACENQDAEPIIYVAINYRLGGFGWMGGDNFVSQGGTANVGLHDQVKAFDWIQDFIEEFGGDINRVTAMGESAGASSILHHITSYGGSEYFKPSFQRAILFSPAFIPQAEKQVPTQKYLTFQFNTSSFSLHSLRQKSTEVLQSQNNVMNYHSNYGSFEFGPTVDGSFVPDLPSKLLHEGKFHSNISVLLGHSYYDGLLFTPPWLRDDAAVRNFTSEQFPQMTEDSLNTVKSLYPIRASNEGRKVLYDVQNLLDDVAVSCNNYYLTQNASGAGVYRYLLGAPPGPIHALIPFYALYPADGEEVPAIPGLAPWKQLARTMQRGFVNYIRDGDPSTADKAWPKYATSGDAQRQVMNFGQTIPTANITAFVGDDKEYKNHDSKAKCEFWQSAPYAPPEEDATQKLVNQQEGKSYEL